VRDAPITAVLLSVTGIIIYLLLHALLRHWHESAIEEKQE